MIDEQTLKQICKNSYTIAEVIKKLGLIPSGGNYATIKRKIKKFNVDISHFKGQGWAKNKSTIHKANYNAEEVLCKNSVVTQKTLRNYIKRHKLIEYKCNICGCDGNWQNSKISLELDHIDGDSKNNVLSNLRYLCPNCHALTSTYRGKNKKNI